MRFVLLALLGAATVAVAPGASAQQADDVTVGDCTETSAQVEAADRAFVATASAHFDAGGVVVMASDLDGLEAVLKRHPDRHRVEQCGDVIRVNSGDPQDGLMVQAEMVGTVTKSTASRLSLDVTPSYLITAAKLAGFAAADRHDYSTAIQWLDQGLGIAPNNPSLAAEAANALAFLHRNEDALALVDRVLKALPDSDDQKVWRAALLRRKGYALGELQRWREAKDAYQRSLVLAPGNSVALNELAYIAAQEQGAPATKATQRVVDVAHPQDGEQKPK